MQPHPLYWVFLVCAVVGSTVVVFQFVLSLVGLGEGHDLPDGHAFDAALPHEMPHDMAHDHDVSAAGHGHDSTWIFGVLSIRAIIAGIAFFGLAGLASLSADLPVVAVVPISLASGVAALGIVHLVMTMLFRLRADGTLRIERAIGQSGTVHLSIPANQTGAGKVQVSVQGRLEEFRAVTSGTQALASGAKVVVIAITEPRTLVVELLPVAKAA